jgi:hypothetical protein
MIRDTSIQYELACELKDNKFINYNNEDFISASQLERVNEYLDDILIEAFFENNSFEPIIIPKGILSKKQTPKGYIETSADLILDLSNRFDRYTFIEALCLLCIHGASPYSDILLTEDEQKFVSELSSDAKLYAAYGRSFVIKTGFASNPLVDMFKNRFKAINFGESKVAELYCFRDFVISSNNTDVNMYYYEHVDYRYSRIRNNRVFGNYTWQEILSIYAILVEKLHLYDDTISALISLYIPKITDLSNQILSQFHNFEKNYSSFIDIHSYLNPNDLFLRFVNAQRTRAFHFKPLDIKNFISIRLFDNPEVIDVDFYNTLPLPYYQNSKIQ